MLRVLGHLSECYRVILLDSAHLFQQWRLLLKFVVLECLARKRFQEGLVQNRISNIKNIKSNITYMFHQFFFNFPSL